jgi:uracil-DNA glycosylase family 4
MFTGDMSGETLMTALHHAGFSNQPSSLDAKDGLRLEAAFITAAVRCAPPQNKPTPQERSNCEPFLAREIELLSSVKVVLALGRFAFDAYRRFLKRKGLPVKGWTFVHGAVYQGNPHLVASYHPSQRNTQTGLLTPKMLNEVLAKVSALIASR